jgi:hypothetical protein
VRPGPGVDDRGVGEVDDAVQLLDELTLVVGLKEARVDRELDRERIDRLLELQKRHPAVVRGIAPPELVEVDAVHHVDAVVVTDGHVRSLWHGAASGATPARRGGSGQPARAARSSARSVCLAALTVAW